MDAVCLGNFVGSTSDVGMNSGVASVVVYQRFFHFHVGSQARFLLKTLIHLEEKLFLHTIEVILRFCFEEPALFFCH